jgi:hypothetical protein
MFLSLAGFREIASATISLFWSRPDAYATRKIIEDGMGVPPVLSTGAKSGFRGLARASTLFVASFHLWVTTTRPPSQLAQQQLQDNRPLAKVAVGVL